MVKRWLPLIVLACLVTAAFALDLDRFLSLEALRDHRAALKAAVDNHTLTAIVGFVVAYAVVVALSLPGATVMTLAGGFLFGTWLGASLNVVGATAGAAALFLVARSAIGDALRRRAGPFLTRMEEGFRRDAFNYLLFLRLVPVFPFWAVNLVPALLGTRAAPFVAATMIGIIPGTIVYTAFGAGLGQIFDAGAEVNLSDVFSPTLIAAMVGLGMLSLLPIAVRRLRERNGRRQQKHGGSDVRTRKTNG
ncbi:MAG: TVP38/TMEM64 family protein [Rhodospirillales bacterium]|nr:TVP38/TMEM64 family protein [Rhodospirillales bacterium]